MNNIATSGIPGPLSALMLWLYIDFMSPLMCFHLIGLSSVGLKNFLAIFFGMDIQITQLTKQSTLLPIDAATYRKMCWKEPSS